MNRDLMIERWLNESKANIFLFERQPEMKGALRLAVLNFLLFCDNEALQEKIKKIEGAA